MYNVLESSKSRQNPQKPITNYYNPSTHPIIAQQCRKIHSLQQVNRVNKLSAVNRVHSRKSASREQTQLQKPRNSLVFRRFGRSRQKPRVFLLLQPVEDLLHVFVLLSFLVLELFHEVEVPFLFFFAWRRKF